MPPTIFEKIINREIPACIVYEDEHTIAILDINPKTLGHSLVIPKVVSRTFLDMNPQSLGHYFTVVQKIAQAIKESLNADGVNIMINTESAAGQEIFHTHTHIIPRYKYKETILNTSDHEAYASTEEMEGYAQKIRGCLDCSV
jgi:histidine triad (HIT) family protein